MRTPTTALAGLLVLALTAAACSAPDASPAASEQEPVEVSPRVGAARRAPLVGAGPILGIGGPDPISARQPAPPTTAAATTTTSTTLVVTTTTTTVASTTTTTSPPTPTTTVAPPPPPPPPPPPTTTTTIVTTTLAPTTTTTAAPSGGFSSSAEAEFTAMINSLRSSVGVGGLSRDGSLDAYARDWALHMAERGDLTHSDIAGLLGPWSTVGENIAFGGSVSQIFGNLDASSGHHANMVNGSFTHVGVGAWIDGAGVMWTTHVFAG